MGKGLVIQWVLLQVALDQLGQELGTCGGGRPTGLCGDQTGPQGLSETRRSPVACSLENRAVGPWLDALEPVDGLAARTGNLANKSSKIVL